MVKMIKSRSGSDTDSSNDTQCSFHFLSFCYGWSAGLFLYTFLFYIIPIHIVPLFK